jgi:peptidylprolyl isomerase|nr:FKBP-type peptidyl-prolyl cis-trans isomerase [Candidatus Krumholzibacteria bacterium]
MRKMLLTVFVILMTVSFALTGCQETGKAEQAAATWQEIVPGLTYVDSTLGSGDVVGASDFVEVHYTGWLFEDGAKTTQFDSSVERGEPIAFPLGRSFVIPGWEKGLVGMKVGGKRTLKIENELAYGPNGRPPVIPPAATLMFDVEIVSIPRVEILDRVNGSGPMAELGDQVNVHYTGWLWEDGAKGSEFDSSFKRNRPFKFALGAGQVIQGWDVAFEGMTVGTKATLIIPPAMGYGARASASIPANSTLCFEVELVSIEGK